VGVGHDRSSGVRVEGRREGGGGVVVVVVVVVVVGGGVQGGTRGTESVSWYRNRSGYGRVGPSEVHEVRLGRGGSARGTGD
jgi:hypothetical protein